jgi:hypothetical protein
MLSIWWLLAAVAVAVLANVVAVAVVLAGYWLAQFLYQMFLKTSLLGQEAQVEQPPHLVVAAVIPHFLQQRQPTAAAVVARVPQTTRVVRVDRAVVAERLPWVEHQQVGLQRKTKEMLVAQVSTLP